MSECDICADRELGSCGGAPEKSPLKPFVPLSIQRSERQGDCWPRFGGAAKGSNRRNVYFFFKLEVFSFYLRIVSLVQHASRGMLYPTSWPMLTSISSATLKARSIACCA